MMASHFDFIYLASQSPRRQELLKQINVRYECLLPSDEENAEALETCLSGEDPYTYVQRVTRLKLEMALKRLNRLQLVTAPVLCADTTVAWQNAIYGKPTNNDDAFRMLNALQGHKHQVMTSVAVAVLLTDGSLKEWQLTSLSEVTMAPMTPKAICAYIASGEHQGKAGAYGIQGRMAAYISRIEGSYSGIMGLPLFETAQILRQVGLIGFS